MPGDDAAAAAAAASAAAAAAAAAAVRTPRQREYERPLIRARLITYPVMMLTSALILTCEAFAINYIASPSGTEQLLRNAHYTVNYHEPLVAERNLEFLQAWGLDEHNWLAIYAEKTPVQTHPHMPYHRAGRHRLPLARCRACLPLRADPLAAAAAAAALRVPRAVQGEARAQRTVVEVRLPHPSQALPERLGYDAAAHADR